MQYITDIDGRFAIWGRYNLAQDIDKENYCFKEDRAFAEGTLAPKLENLHGLSLYLFDRDGIPGRLLNATVVDNIQESRKTIIVIFTCEESSLFV